MQPQSSEPQYARLNCRVSARIKHRAEEAAALLGQSITDFTETALADRAQAVLENHERIVLSDRDFQRFVEAIENPGTPSKAMREAVADYSRLAAENPDANL